MTLFGVIGITFPWLLLALLALPILWVLLRAVPPAPQRHRFPGVALLLGLKDDEVESDKTPWWLLLLRGLAIAGLIVGFAGPILNPQVDRENSGPLLVVMDGTWAEAPDWRQRQDRAVEVMEAAGREGRDVAFIQLTQEPLPNFGPASLATRQVKAAMPQPWVPKTTQSWVDELPQNVETYWLAAPVAWDGQPSLIQRLQRAGDVTLFETGRTALALAPITIVEGGVTVTAKRSRPGPALAQGIDAIGLDPGGVERALQSGILRFDAGEVETQATLDMPAEIRNRVTRFALTGQVSAGAVVLGDDRLNRREIALISDQAGGQESLALLSPLHYLRQALAPSSDLINGTLDDILQANPDTIILADVARVAQDLALLDWVEQGGLLVRFAGPRVAAHSFEQLDDDPLMPVQLRAGGRTVGGAMSWGAPKTLQEFAPETPFFGLPVPNEVSVTAQVLAEPGPDLANRVIARLEDGTPLVTRQKIGQGQIILFHVTANAEWSNLPLSGLFMDMLERLSVVDANAVLDVAVMEGTTWQLDQRLDGFGRLKDAGDRAGIDGAALVGTALSDAVPPGLYSGADRRLARNVVQADMVIAAPTWPDGVRIEGPTEAKPRDLTQWFLLAALVAVAVDLVVSLGLAGKLRGPIAAAVVLAVSSITLPNTADAQENLDRALAATGAVVLAYVETGDARQDNISRAGLSGLSLTLFQRTSIEPIAPNGVNLAEDELSFYPFLYWPITLNQKPPSEAVRAKLNRYIKGGGMIMFDTRDGQLAQYGRSTKEGRLLQDIAAGLNIPPIAQIPNDHVLTRTFYLLQEFPGRFAGGTIWVEAPRSDAQQIEGLPFRTLNDGVTPVVIGGNDWAAAWAIDDNRQPLLPVGRGFAGERQREIARRFGVNLIMHVLTGNYKSDQVHVPALLDRLGQ